VITNPKYRGAVRDPHGVSIENTLVAAHSILHRIDR